jgi:hypothetical protein
LTTTYLLAGVYRLHHFAADSWLKLTEFCCLSREVDKGSPDWTELIDLLQSLSTLRCNVGYLPFDEAADLPHLKHVQDAKGEVYELLCRETQFRKKCTVRLFKLGQGKFSTLDELPNYWIIYKDEADNDFFQVLGKLQTL